MRPKGGDGMSGLLFQMWEPFRQSLIKSHLFYVGQARKRLLSQFDDIGADADRAADEWLEKSAQWFDPDRHDPASFYENANDVGIEFYGLLSDMLEQTRLSVVAGMFHEWDKQLRDWLVREIKYWHRGDNATDMVWRADFSKIVDLLESLGWNVRNADFFSTLDACRLVVNVYKHGDGSSLRHLRKNFPEYLEDRFHHHHHTHLKVNDGQLDAFSNAILAFWRNVPNNVSDSCWTDVQKWVDTMDQILEKKKKRQAINDE
ncbi:MAG: hypothetical protein ACK53K_07685 [Burkholderiales bacterium]